MNYHLMCIRQANQSLILFCNSSLLKNFPKTLQLENIRVEIVLLNNTTDGNTSSGFHPVQKWTK